MERKEEGISKEKISLEMPLPLTQYNNLSLYAVPSLTLLAHTVHEKSLTKNLTWIYMERKEEGISKE